MCPLDGEASAAPSHTLHSINKLGYQRNRSLLVHRPAPWPVFRLVLYWNGMKNHIPEQIVWILVGVLVAATIFLAHGYRQSVPGVATNGNFSQQNTADIYNSCMYLMDLAYANCMSIPNDPVYHSHDRDCCMLAWEAIFARCNYNYPRSGMFWAKYGATQC